MQVRRLEIVELSDGGMKLLATAAAAISYVCPMHPEVVSDPARPLSDVR
jgi:hypothetical protein